MTVYIWKDGSGNILSFGETPFGLSGSETQEEILDTMAEYESRLIIESSEQISPINVGITITVMTSILIATIDLLIETFSLDGELLNSIVEIVTITAGEGSFTITSTQPSKMTIFPDDKTLFASSGQGSANIQFED